jgi:regulator of RNase E activity RraA
MKKQILALEQQDAEKAAEAKKKEQELEKSMRKELLSKDKIYQDYYRLQREKDQVEQEYALRLE